MNPDMPGFEDENNESGNASTKEKRKQIHRSLQRWGRDQEMEEAVLVGWVVVAEWFDGSKKWLQRIAGTEDVSLTPWQRNGYLHEALNGDWDDDDLDCDCGRHDRRDDG